MFTLESLMEDKAFINIYIYIYRLVLILNVEIGFSCCSVEWQHYIPVGYRAAGHPKIKKIKKNPQLFALSALTESLDEAVFQNNDIIQPTVFNQLNVKNISKCPLYLSVFPVCGPQEVKVLTPPP